MKYSSDLSSPSQLKLLQKIAIDLPKLRKYTILEIFNAIAYVVKSGCQWKMLPKAYPNWKTVYHHFKAWSGKRVFSELLSMLVYNKRKLLGKCAPTVGIIDSQSVRSALPQSEKGVDGFKKVKGIKRHLITDSNGYPLQVMSTPANVHDSKAAIPLIESTLSKWNKLIKIKADKGYCGAFANHPNLQCKVILECVKSNFGTSEFIPLQGRWVVERTFAWLEKYRRLNRNYEKTLSSADAMAMMACTCFMFRYFR